MSEVPTPIPPVDLDSQFEVPSPAARRGGRWARTIAPAVLAVGILPGCAFPGGGSDENEKPPYSTTQSTETKKQSLSSMGDEVKKIESDPANSYLNSEYIHLTYGLADSYEESDFVEFKNITPEGEEIVNNWPEKSAPVVELVFDKEQKQIVVRGKSAKVKDADLYDLLKPLNDNDLVLKTAFEAGQLDRVVIRLQQYDASSAYNELWFAEFENSDRTETDNPQKTVFMFLPASGLLSKKEYTMTIDHEGGHALTQGSSLSMEGDKPTAEDLKHWSDICVDFRNFAIDDAEQYSYRMMDSMEAIKDKLTDPAVKRTFTEVMKSLENGTFNKLQPKPGVHHESFDAEVPECRAIGPWGAFLQLLERRKISTDSFLGPQTYSDPSWDGFHDKVSDLMTAWQETIETDTIYEAFKESEYEQSSASTSPGLGHPEDNWDELITSVNNVALSNPDRLKTYIDRLSKGRKDAARRLITVSLDYLLTNYPQERFPHFHKVITQRRGLILGLNVRK